MAITKAETMKLIGQSFINVGEAMQKKSDGGEDVTANEIIDISSETIQNVLNEWRDNDDE